MTVEYPEIRYVVLPTHIDGTVIGTPPRMRHDPGCLHFQWDFGELGVPVLASPEQMMSLRACKTCVARRWG